MTRLRNLAGELVESDVTFVCKDCTLEHPAEDFGAAEVTAKGIHNVVDYLCAHCIKTGHNMERIYRSDDSGRAELVAAFVGLKEGETFYIINASRAA